jgi:hypothetical protein
MSESTISLGQAQTLPIEREIMARHPDSGWAAGRARRVASALRA